MQNPQGAGASWTLPAVLGHHGGIALSWANREGHQRGLCRLSARGSERSKDPYLTNLLDFHMTLVFGCLSWILKAMPDRSCREF